MEYLKDELANLISSLSEDNFNILVKNFTKEYFKASDVRIINGSYDGGIDLEIRQGKRLIKRNIQITVQKTKLEQKIKDDLGKAKKNIKKFDYLKNLDFYCTSKISPLTKRTYKRIAQVDFNIELEIFDANDLAELSEEFSSIKNSVYKIFNLKTEPLINVDKQTKVLYDLFAIAKCVSSPKNSTF